jgi:excisionase family DNA binding protein
MTTSLSQPNQKINSPIVKENEIEAIKQMQELLTQNNHQLKLVIDGQEIPLTDAFSYILRQVAQAMASGKYVSVVTYNPELTTEQAADLLNVSPSYLMKLLDQGELAYIMVGNQKRVNFDDLMKYKEERDAKRDKFLTELTQMSQEAGFYE